MKEVVKIDVDSDDEPPPVGHAAPVDARQAETDATETPADGQESEAGEDDTHAAEEDQSDGPDWRAGEASGNSSDEEAPLPLPEGS